MTSMLLATLLAAAAAAAPTAPAQAPAATLDMVPPFIGACMANGPDAEKIRAAVVKAGGKPAPAQLGKTATDASRLQAYLFDNGGAPFSVIFDRAGTCSVVAGRVDLEVTKSSLDRLVIGSSKVFDIRQTNPKPHGPGETITVEYELLSKNKQGGLLLTLSHVTDPKKGTIIFLTRRVMSGSK